MTTTAVTTRPVVLLFPGQGAQQARMAAGLYRRDSVFTTVMDELFGLLDDGDRLRDRWLDPGATPDFDDVTVAQPLLYGVDCALGRMVLSWGVRPDAVLGHSVGEMAAATVAGVFSFRDGVRLMQDRVAAFAGSAPGGMLAVAASAAEVTPFLGGDVVIGAINAARQVMLAGPADGLAAIAARLQAHDVTCLPVKARQGFHSPMLAGAAAGSVPAWEATELRAPRITVWSAYLTAPLTAETVRDAAFWAGQPAAPVHFGPTLDAVLAHGDRLLVEAGPGQGLSTLARRQPGVAAGRSAVVPLLPLRSGDDASDLRCVERAAQRIAAEGHLIDRAAVRG